MQAVGKKGDHLTSPLLHRWRMERWWTSGRWWYSTLYPCLHEARRLEFQRFHRLRTSIDWTLRIVWTKLNVDFTTPQTAHYDDRRKGSEILRFCDLQGAPGTSDWRFQNRAAEVSPSGLRGPLQTPREYIQTLALACSSSNCTPSPIQPSDLIAWLPDLT